jgi:hypothetical protein
MLYTVSRLGALFGVSILEDKGYARNELWDVVYHMSRQSSSALTSKDFSSEIGILQSFKDFFKEFHF